MKTNYKQAVEAIRKQLHDYITTNGLKSLVVGISGGIDSALSAALAHPVCVSLGIPIIGRSITIVSNKPDEIKRAAGIGAHFITDFKEVNLSEQFHLLSKLVMEDAKTASPDDFDFKIRLGNIKARCRMMYLYDLAGKHKGMVLSTDNYTELLLGFWTLHGDVGDYGMIQNLWKGEVYDMASHIASKLDSPEAAQALIACVDALPTDGLGITNSDLDQLGAPTYNDVDIVLKRYLKNPDDPEIQNHPVVQRHVRSEYKRNNPYNIPRNRIFGAE